MTGANQELESSRRLPAMRLPITRRHSPATLRHRGLSLMELMLVLTIMGILVSMSAPSFHRTMEQSRADIAAANLRAIWTAERLYWLEYRTYSDGLSELESLGLLDPTIVSAAGRYAYEIQSADTSTFTAAAIRSGSGRWSGQLSIDETGNVQGYIAATGQPNIEPGFL